MSAGGVEGARREGAGGGGGGRQATPGRTSDGSPSRSLKHACASSRSVWGLGFVLRMPTEKNITRMHGQRRVAALCGVSVYISVAERSRSSCAPAMEEHTRAPFEEGTSSTPCRPACQRLWRRGRCNARLLVRRVELGGKPLLALALLLALLALARLQHPAAPRTERRVRSSARDVARRRTRREVGQTTVNAHCRHVYRLMWWRWSSAHARARRVRG